VFVSDPSPAQASIFLRVPGGEDAPKRARTSVLAQLDGQVPTTTASTVALIVSELVTALVVQADVGPDRVLSLELLSLDDRLQIVVLDPGSDLTPQMHVRDLETSGGLGLMLLDELCEAWGVDQDGGGRCLWCDLLVQRASAA
jgi:anti-sigma regulatory factor (Ser/Thr protein kinase)